MSAGVSVKCGIPFCRRETLAVTSLICDKCSVLASECIRTRENKFGNEEDSTGVTERIRRVPDEISDFLVTSMIFSSLIPLNWPVNNDKKIKHARLYVAHI